MVGSTIPSASSPAFSSGVMVMSLTLELNARETMLSGFMGMSGWDEAPVGKPTPDNPLNERCHGFLYSRRGNHHKKSKARPRRGEGRCDAAALWSARDLSPLWVDAERRWPNGCGPQKLVQRGSAATQSGDK